MVLSHGSRLTEVLRIYVDSLLDSRGFLPRRVINGTYYNGTLLVGRARSFMKGTV